MQRMLRQRLGERAAVADRVAQRQQDRSGARAVRGFHQELQGAIQILAGCKHGREFAGEVGDFLPTQPPAAADIGVEQAAEYAGAAAGRLGAHRRAALALQAVDHGGLVGRLHHAALQLAGRARPG